MGKRAVAAVAWKCGNPRSVRVSKRRGRTKNLRLAIPPDRPRRTISTAKQRILSIFLRNRVFGLPEALKSSFYRKPPKMHPSSDSCAEPTYLIAAAILFVCFTVLYSAGANASTRSTSVRKAV